MAKSAFQIKNQRGFTLLEVIIALGVIMTVLVGIFSLSVTNLRAARVSRDQATAALLAQEGIEVLRSIRDSNWLSYPDEPERWLDGIVGSGYRVDATHDCTPPVYDDCVAGAGSVPLNIADDGRFTYDSGAPSPFYRVMSLIDTGNDEAVITATVTWRSGSANSAFVLEDKLTNWR